MAPTLATTTGLSWPYPTSANDGTDFSTGIADFAAAADTTVTGMAPFKRLSKSANYTAHPGESIVCTGSTGFTILTPASNTGAFQVINAMTGGAVVIVAAQSGTSLYGYGSGSLSTITLTATDWPATFTAADFSGYLVTDWFDGLVGPWLPLTLASGVSAAGSQYVPSARAELGGIVRLKGVLENTSGSGISALTALATSPSPLRPSVNDVPLSCVTGTGSDNGVLWAQVSGAIVLASGTLAASHFVYLDGITFTTS